MRLYEKYPQLCDRAFLANMIAESVYANMALEDQRVHIDDVREMVEALLREKESEGNHFFSDKHGQS